MKNYREEREEDYYDDDAFSDKFDLYKKFIKVHSKIKSHITEDVVLAKFRQEKDKVYIIEMSSCGIQCKQVVDDMIRNHELNCKRDNKEFSKEERDYMAKNMHQVFGIFMNQISMLSCVSRNESDNHLINALSNFAPDEIITEEEDNRESKPVKAIRKIKERLGKKEENE